MNALLRMTVAVSLDTCIRARLLDMQGCLSMSGSRSGTLIVYEPFTAICWHMVQGRGGSGPRHTTCVIVAGLCETLRGRCARDKEILARTALGRTSTCAPVPPAAAAPPL